MERKKIIISEIKYWKENRLLPEQYCNFLLSLYTEGEETEDIQNSKSKSAIGLFHFVIPTFALALFGFTFLVIYFTDFSPFLQTGLVLILSGIMFLVAGKVKKFDLRFVHLFILLGAIMILQASIHAVQLLFPNQEAAILGAVIITCLAWVFFGKKYNLKYLIISGGIGIVLVIYFSLK